jgi:protein ImuB
VPGALEAVARACSPRVVPWQDTAVVFDASGLDRAIGPPAHIASEVSRLAAERGVPVHVALAGAVSSAWILAHAPPGATSGGTPKVSIVMPGTEAAALAPLPLDSLRSLAFDSLALDSPKELRSLRPGAGPTGFRFAPDLECLEILQRWGLRTLGDLARLPRGDLRARLGPDGVRLHQAASGEDECPLAPIDEAVRFTERTVLEWPIDGLEPLAFVVGRMCDALEARLARADRGAVTLVTRLRLVTKTAHERTLNIPAPMRDARVLRTLILLDLESHPPDAAIDIVDLDLQVAPGRITSGTLFDLTLPSPEDIATLVARLGALMGETRVGAPALVDTSDERSRTMKAFRLTADGLRLTADGLRLTAENAAAAGPSLRRLPMPIAARVTVEHGRPVRVQPSARGMAGGRVTHVAGPWRSSGAWWTLDRRTTWDRDEWDVELPDGIYRLTRDRATDVWTVDGIVD